MQGLQPFYRYFEFHGRSTRAEFWQYIAITTVAGWLTGILDALQSSPYEASHKFTAILGIATIIPTVAVGIRRFHDRDKSGWYYGTFCGLLGVAFSMLTIGTAVQQRTGDTTYTGVGAVLFFVWLVYAIYCIVQLAKPSDPFANSYGDPASGKHFTTVDLAAKARAFQDSFVAKTGSSAPSTDADPLVQIERLAKLRDAGVLTDDEFTRQKATYLARLEASNAAHPANKGMGQ